MKVLHEQTQVMAVKEMNISTMTKEVLTGNSEVKERKSSDASLLNVVMNPVASGDNVTTGLNSTHKLKEDLPPLVPCCEGKELEINEDLIRSGLSAISVRHESVIQCLSMSHATDRLLPLQGLVKHRNSFRCLHRPDLKRVPFLRRMSPDELQTLFRGNLDPPPRASTIETKSESSRATSLHNNIHTKDLKERETIQDVCKAAGAVLHPILEKRSGAEDVPAGMRLHGARARLYTSVLAGAKAGDTLDSTSTSEDIHSSIPDDLNADDEVQLNEELQIILPPRCDDITADSSVTTTSTDS